MNRENASPGDRIGIEEALHRYTRGVDRRDWDLVRSAYHPDATDDHGAYSGGVDGFVDFLRERHENIEQCLHMLSNITMEFGSGGVALVESYYLSFQRSESGENDADGTATQIMAAGRYIDRFEKRAGEWRIARRTVTFELMQSMPAKAGGGFPPMFLQSRRDASDILYEERRQIGDT